MIDVCLGREGIGDEPSAVQDRLASPLEIEALAIAPWTPLDLSPAGMIQ
jgi:hypothetical protein